MSLPPYRSLVATAFLVASSLLFACGGQLLELDDAGESDAEPQSQPGSTSSSGGTTGGSGSGIVGSSGGSSSSGGIGSSSGGGSGGAGSGNSSGTGSGSGGAAGDGGADADSASDATLVSSNDASTDDAEAEDAGVGSNCGVGDANGTCNPPEPLGSCVPSYVPPVQAKGSCSAADVTTFYNDCINSGENCTGSDLSSQACYRCLWTPASSSPWGALVEYPFESSYAFTFNVGGCYGLIGSGVACSAAVEEENECLIAACTASCWQYSDADWSTCTNTAGEDGGECTTYVNAATTSCPASIVDAGACSGNQPDGGVTLIYFALAQTFCE